MKGKEPGQEKKQEQRKEEKEPGNEQEKKPGQEQRKEKEPGHQQELCKRTEAGASNFLLLTLYWEYELYSVHYMIKF